MGRRVYLAVLEDFLIGSVSIFQLHQMGDGGRNIERGPYKCEVYRYFRQLVGTDGRYHALFLLFLALEENIKTRSFRL